ncbi:YheV family putative zinc ribbon protein [Gallaecimonas sp. GXIMD4217]|uniref:YheV family putative zinc ribbon protein n=1 Tax=Gallaecimonas sp. GXIMD4217 TaxID=3131927 RepID=UPI00311B09FD
MAKKRFIAGAVCPQCKEQDVIQLIAENNVERIQCVACGYSQTQEPEEVKQASREAEQVIGLFKPE